jgi:hypothetical protein
LNTFLACSKLTSSNFKGPVATAGSPQSLKYLFRLMRKEIEKCLQVNHFCVRRKHHNAGVRHVKGTTLLRMTLTTHGKLVLGSWGCFGIAKQISVFSSND